MLLQSLSLILNLETQSGGFDTRKSLDMVPHLISKVVLFLLDC